MTFPSRPRPRPRSPQSSGRSSVRGGQAFGAELDPQGKAAPDASRSRERKTCTAWIDLRLALGAPGWFKSRAGRRIQVTAWVPACAPNPIQHGPWRPLRVRSGDRRLRRAVGPPRQGFFESCAAIAAEPDPSDPARAASPACHSWPGSLCRPGCRGARACQWCSPRRRTRVGSFPRRAGDPIQPP